MNGLVVILIGGGLIALLAEIQMRAVAWVRRREGW